MRAQPNSAALKNASVFGAPELRQRAGVMRNGARRRGFLITTIHVRGGAGWARTAAKLNQNNKYQTELLYDLLCIQKF